MGFFDWFDDLCVKAGKDMFNYLNYIHDHYEKADVSVECEDSADNGVINIDNSYITIYNF